MKRTKYFIGDCVSNPFDTPDELFDIINNAKQISRKKFLSNCFVMPQLARQMKKFKNSFSYWQNGNIMFYEWSRIESFYK